MGEVYRATDTRLKRDVAIKVLPEIVRDDPERMARLQREAELLAALGLVRRARAARAVAEVGRTQHRAD